MISEMPLTQLIAVFTPAENVFGSFAEAAAFNRERREREAAEEGAGDGD